MVQMDEDQRKYLEMIQAVIARLASNSFILKGWSVTLVSGLIGFAGRQREAQVVLLALLPAITFWMLDAYYLAQERQQRELFSRARDGGSPAYTFDVPSLKGKDWLDAVRDSTVCGLHGPLVVLTVVLALVWWLSP
jgi:hypothetical protein